MKICGHSKVGEYDRLICVREAGHKDFHNYVVWEPTYADAHDESCVCPDCLDPSPETQEEVTSGGGFSDKQAEILRKAPR